MRTKALATGSLRARLLTNFDRMKVHKVRKLNKRTSTAIVANCAGLHILV